MRIRKGDKVIVRQGKYKGQVGKVLSAHPRINSLTVEGINIVKKAVKPNKAYPQGGLIEITRPINVSKVSILDPETKKGTRIGYSIKADGSKVRVFKSSGKEIK
ncbi:MAG TPA: 50S ribosomal protein L24 [Candidatus Saccharimonadales bacterium]|nr:50S ribosomal protein L24 [Candidatus Saccharimonadales bacterium]